MAEAEPHPPAEAHNLIRCTLVEISTSVLIAILRVHQSKAIKLSKTGKRELLGAFI